MSGSRRVVVFGGTGFLGRRVVRHLLQHGFAPRVASRHPDRGAAAFTGGSGLDFVNADIADRSSVGAAVAGAFAVVNAVSLYVERNGATFRSVHVDAAATVAEAAHRCGMARLVHTSGIGADPQSGSSYIRSRGDGEAAVRAAFAAATIVRPAVMFGRDDAFLEPLAGMLRSVPVFPLFGRGTTRLQPVFVEDVAEAIVRAIATPTPAPLYELGGPQTFTYAELLRTVAARLRSHPILLPVPFAIWRLLAFAAEALPRAPITRNQVELMMCDTIASSDVPGFQHLGIEPRGIGDVLDQVSHR